MAAYHRVDEL